jgi:hypothetical protein
MATPAVCAEGAAREALHDDLPFARVQPEYELALAASQAQLSDLHADVPACLAGVLQLKFTIWLTERAQASTDWARFLRGRGGLALVAAQDAARGFKFYLCKLASEPRIARVRSTDGRLHLFAPDVEHVQRLLPVGGRPATSQNGAHRLVSLLANPGESGMRLVVVAKTLKATKVVDVHPLIQPHRTEVLYELGRQ